MQIIASNKILKKMEILNSMLYQFEASSATSPDAYKVASAEVSSVDANWQKSSIFC